MGGDVGLAEDVVNSDALVEMNSKKFSIPQFDQN